MSLFTRKVFIVGQDKELDVEWSGLDVGSKIFYVIRYKEV